MHDLLPAHPWMRTASWTGAGGVGVDVAVAALVRLLVIVAVVAVGRVWVLGWVAHEAWGRKTTFTIPSSFFWKLA